jgi:hypothetical protein
MVSGTSVRIEIRFFSQLTQHVVLLLSFRPMLGQPKARFDTKDAFDVQDFVPHGGDADCPWSFRQTAGDS